MRFLPVAELLLLLSVLAVVVTQVLVPLARGRRVFPLLRRQGKLESELAEAKQELAERDVVRSINRTKKGISK